MGLTNPFSLEKFLNLYQLSRCRKCIVAVLVLNIRWRSLVTVGKVWSGGKYESLLCLLHVDGRISIMNIIATPVVVVSAN